MTDIRIKAQLHNKVRRLRMERQKIRTHIYVRYGSYNKVLVPEAKHLFDAMLFRTNQIEMYEEELRMKQNS